MMNLPEVRLTIEGMTHQIVNALNDYNSNIEEHVKAEVAKAVAAFDFEKSVKEVADEAIKRAVGEGVNSLISYDVREQIAKEVREKIRVKINS